jgi:PAS domain S-box-containing protein/putative nucleotidyltransferase with HDIG domain
MNLKYEVSMKEKSVLKGYEPITKQRTVRESNAEKDSLPASGQIRIQAEEELKAAEVGYQALVEQIPAIIYVDSAKKKGRTLYISPQITTILGYSAEEWSANNLFWENSIVPEDRKQVLREYTRTFINGEPFRMEYRLVTHEGDIVWVRDEAELVREESGQPLFWRGIMLNITERKQAELALEESETKYRNVVERANDGIAIIQDGIIKYANPRLLQMGDWSLDEVIGMPLANFIFPDEVFAVMERYKKRIAGVDVPSNYETVLLHRDKSKIFVELNAGIIQYEGAFADLVMVHDISERKLAEIMIKKSETSYRDLFNQVSEAIYIQDQTGKFLDVNEGAASMYGYPLEYLIGKSPVDVGAPGRNDLESIRAYIDKAFKGQPQQFEFWGKRRNGEIFPKDVRLNKGIYFGQEVVIAIAQDITERKKAEEALQRQLKELTILHSVSMTAAKASSIDQTIEQITQIIGDLVYVDDFGVALFDQTKQELQPHSSYHGESVEAWASIPLKKSLVGKVATSGDSYYAADVRIDPYYLNTIPETLSELCVPIMVDHKVVGVINAESRQLNYFSEEDERLFNTIAGIMATNFERLELIEAERTRLHESETLREALAVVTSTLDREHAVKLILEQLARVVRYDSASVLIIKGDCLEIVGGQGWEEPEAVLGLQIPIPGDNPNTIVIQKRRPVILKNAPKEYNSFRQKPHHHILSWLGVPMIVRDRVIGMLAVDSKKANYFTEDNIKFVSAFANQAATTIENARLYEQAIQAAERRVILHRASQEIAQASRDPEQVYATVHRAAEQLMPAEAFVITLLDEQTEETIGVYLMDKGKRASIDRIPGKAGLSGLVLKTGNSIITRDLMVEPIPGSVHFGGDDEVRSILAVPLRLGEKVIGMLSVQSYQAHAYTEDDQVLLEMLAAHAAVAIENARLYAETLQRLKELEAVNHISTVLRAAQTVDDMLPSLLDETLKVLGSDSGVIWLYDQTNSVLKERVARGWFTALAELPVRLGEGIAGTVFKTGKESVSKEFATDPLTRESTRDQIPKGWGGACVPIRTGREVIGVLFVSVELPRQLQADGVHLLVTLSEMAGNAIHRATLHEQTERQLQRMASLRSVDMAINTILDLRVTLGILIDHIISQLKVDAVDILLINQNSPTLYTAASSGFQSDSIKNKRLYVGDSLAGQAVRTRKIVHIPNLTESTLQTRTELLTEEGFVTYFAVPLIAKGQVKGVLETYHRDLVEPDAEWKNFLETLAGQAAIAIDNSVLFEELQQTNMNLSLAYDATIEGWSKALDLRDQGTEGHALRVTDMTMRLADMMGVSPAEQVHIRRGALLHDIGKMGIPDNILYKPGPLSEVEWSVMRDHPKFAYEMLSPILYLRPALDIPYCHHERWDGSGYPRQLQGEQIPLAARIFAVVDAWDALLSERSYRNAMTKQEAMDYIKTNSGKLFDPQVVQVFLQMIEDEKTRLEQEADSAG